MERVIRLSIVSIVVFVFCLFMVSAENCWDNDFDQTGCEAAGCNWQDPWCEELDCWSLYNTDTCLNDTDTVTGCTWKSDSWGMCENLNCWSFAGDQTSCQAAITNYNLSCEWVQECSGPNNCWDMNSQTTCEERTGCTWGNCMEVGCWSYETNFTCSQADRCTWSTYGYCYDEGCWDDNHNTNATCVADSNCKWDSAGGYCMEQGCWDNDYDQDACLAAGCEWNNPWCNDPGCWNNNDANSCNAASGAGFSCIWTTGAGGWCEKAGCWQWDDISLNGEATEEICRDNATLYGLDCEWNNDGWCYQNFDNINCSSTTTEKGCFDTMYCWWDFSQQTCNEPEGGDMMGGSAAWNPGCYIFDTNGTTCDEKINGNCTYIVASDTASQCVGMTDEVNSLGLTCDMINDSTLCESIPMLDTCCVWQAGECQQSFMTSACWDNMDDPPEGAFFCRDYNALFDQTLCNQIAGDPWYMPCRWDSSSQECTFYMEGGDDVGSGNTFESLNNKQNCDAAGGKWVTEQYCDGTTAKSTGWCEPKTGAGAMSCDSSCWACEYKKDGSAWSTVNAARDSCENSKAGAPPGSAKGWCSWTTDENASNSLGYCDEPKEAHNGGADCNTNCWACELVGDSLMGEPQAACKKSAANCKWIKDFMDSGNAAKGACVGAGVQTCNTDCNLCPDESSCLDTTRNITCRWDINPYNGMSECKGQGDSGEICFNMVDDDNDGMIDCADNECMTDPFCGGGSFTDCGQYSGSEESCNEDENCGWMTDSFGGSWCDMKGADCYQYDGNQVNCELDTDCIWETPMYDMSMCNIDNSKEEVCRNIYDSASCTANSNLCVWKSNQEDQWCMDNPSNPWCQDVDSGFCQFKFFGCHDNFTRQMGVEQCTAGDLGCVWINDPFMPGSGGFCDVPCYQPGLTSEQCLGIPGGICQTSNGFCNPLMSGGSGGVDCWLNDDDPTACGEMEACTWYVEPMPFCDMMVSGLDCPSLTYQDASMTVNMQACLGAEDCKWVPFDQNEGGDPLNGFCDDSIFECVWNMTLQSADNCSDAAPRVNCIWMEDYNRCEPAMFGSGNQNNQASCELNGGFWRTGLCDPAGKAAMFQGMDMSPPIPIGGDPCGDTGQASVDLMGFGIKEMDDNFAIGIGVCDFSEAAICNGVLTAKGMMGPMVPGMMEMQGSGTGNETTKFYVYMDTDGSTTGNCNFTGISTNITGFEFLFSYEANWSQSENAASEKKSVYKCTDGVWTSTPIQISTWKQKMCTMIGGGMVSVSKESLMQYPTLFDTNQDWRIMISSANATGSRLTPSDESDNAGYYTVGAMDFSFKDCMSINAMTDPDCVKFQKFGGKIKFEDCFDSGIDEDLDGLVDCDDPDCTCEETDCSDLPQCEGLGVNAISYVDNTLPKVIFMKAEAYTDSALITFDTDEQSNGTLLFYHNDSSCTNLNTTIFDVGLNSTNLRDYRSWHDAPIYSSATSSLTYALATGTPYYYKVKVCDKAGNCGQSACMNFTTAANTSVCNPCEFIFRLKLPSAWNISLDFDQDSIYEITQGYVCGSNAGTKVNHTTARSVNILLNNSAQNTAIYLYNARLTKSALNDKAKTMNTVGSFISGTTTNSAGQTVGYAGLSSETRDMLISKLHPEYCHVKIPSDGTCDALYHCDDNMENCISEVSTGDLIEQGSDYCIWKIPNCKFSVWTSNNPSGTSLSAPGSGGGSTRTTVCNSVWQCTPWSECINSYERRTCEDINKCKVPSYIPETERKCTLSFNPLIGSAVKDLPDKQDTKPQQPKVPDITGFDTLQDAPEKIGSTFGKLLLYTVIVIVVLIIGGIALASKLAINDTRKKQF